MNYTWVDHEIFNIYTVHRLIGVSVYNNYTLSFYTEMWAALFVQLAFSIYISSAGFGSFPIAGWDRNLTELEEPLKEFNPNKEAFAVLVQTCFFPDQYQHITLEYNAWLWFADVLWFFSSASFISPTAVLQQLWQVFTPPSGRPEACCSPDALEIEAAQNSIMDGL